MNYFLKKFKGPLITAAVFAVLLIVIFLPQREKETNIIPAEENAFLEEGEVLSIEVYYPTSWVLLENEEDKWFVVEDDKKLNADSNLVQNLLYDVMNTEIYGTVPTQEVDLEQFGVESAKAEIILITKEDNNHFIIGDEIPVGSGTYVYHPEKKIVYVVEENYLNKFLDLSSVDFRERGLFNFDEDKVNRISIWSGEFSADLIFDNGQWIIDGEDQIVADSKKIDELLWIFSRAKVLGFQDERPQSIEKYGLDDPGTEIRFYEDDKIQGLLFGKRKDEDSYYVKTDTDDAVYTIHISLFKRVPKNIESIASK
ncbi:MAG: DUF4340 domain-containing protein [Thermodesulfobacteriota bacterium]